jgi:hypothetical protein
MPSLRCHHDTNLDTFNVHWIIPLVFKVRPVALYYKHMTVVNDTAEDVRMIIVSDASRCGVTYDHHSANSTGVIYTPRKHI